jgi:hypothetical protein
VSIDQIISVAATVLQALSIAVAAVFAVLGLDAWRRQLVGKRKFELAEEILVTVYKMKNELSFVRNPGAFVGEGKSRPRAAGEPDKWTDQRDTYFVPLQRMRDLTGEFAQFSRMQALADIYFGPEAAKSIDDLRRAFNHVAIAAGMLIRTAGENATHDQVSRWEATIWEGAGEDDKIAMTAEASVSQIDAICRPHLKERF